MTIELLGELKGNMILQYQTRIFSFYWGKRIGRLKWSIKGQTQDKTAFEDKGTRNAPPYTLLSSIC